MLGSQNFDFSRQLKVAGMGEAAQDKLKVARIVVVGAGGLGATALSYLAAAGVGHITIVDHDVIEASNLHRQIPFTYADIGRSKAEVAAEFCRERSPYGVFEAVATRLNAQQWLSLMQAHTLALDCSDDRQLAYMLSDAALLSTKPVVFANAARLDGQLFIMQPSNETPCWRCLWPEQIQPSGDCNAVGVLGPVPGVLGCWQALSAIKLIVGMPLNPSELLYYDFAAMRQCILAIAKQPDCSHRFSQEVYSSRYMQSFVYSNSIDQGKQEGMVIVDIRRPEEWAARALAQADMQVEMSDLLNNPDDYLKAQTRYLLVCAAGARAQHTAGILRQKGYENIFAFPTAW